MSFRSNFVELTDPDAMRALAHPVRLEILHHLLGVETGTATECAEVVGESPSSCSYHLRVLARHGFVAEAAGSDGRERRWRLMVRGFDIAGETPEQRAAGAMLGDELLRQDDQITHSYLREREGYSEEWRQAAIFSRSTLRLTPAELRQLWEGVLTLLEPYLEREKERDWPEEAGRVRVMLRAVPWFEGSSG